MLTSQKKLLFVSCIVDKRHALIRQSQVSHNSIRTNQNNERKTAGNVYPYLKSTYCYKTNSADEEGQIVTETRIEQDSMGELEVPENALYAAQTQRAVNNFPVSGRRLPESFIRALLQVKAAAAKANAELEQISAPMSSAICQSVNDLLTDSDFMHHFPVDIFQTGSGTSTNMNANEVLATLATRNLGESVHPNDHVNYGQSSNDVIPTTIHVSAAVGVAKALLPALEYLQNAIRKKADSVDQFVKTGRTHLMDAMPVRMSQSLKAGRHR